MFKCSTTEKLNMFCDKVELYCLLYAKLVQQIITPFSLYYYSSGVQYVEL